MNSAIRHLTSERRWLYQAWEQAEVELAVSVGTPAAGVIVAQMDRLSLEICEIVDALEVLNAVADGTRRVRLARNG